MAIFTKIARAAVATFTKTNRSLDSDITYDVAVDYDTASLSYDEIGSIVSTPWTSQTKN